MENLIKKLMEEAEEKRKKIIDEAQSVLNSEWEKKKFLIEKEYEEKLKKMKETIDKEIENEIINFKIEKNKEILSFKNQLIDKCEEKIKNKFNEYLNKNIGEIIFQILQTINDKKVKILVPENVNLKIDGYEVIKEKHLEDKFLIEGENSDIEFSWENIKKTIGQELRKEVAEKLFNGKESYIKE